MTEPAQPDLFELAEEEEAESFDWTPFLEWHMDRVEVGAYRVRSENEIERESTG